MNKELSKNKKRRRWKNYSYAVFDRMTEEEYAVYISKMTEQMEFIESLEQAETEESYESQYNTEKLFCNDETDWYYPDDD